MYIYIYIMYFNVMYCHVMFMKCKTQPPGMKWNSMHCNVKYMSCNVSEFDAMGRQSTPHRVSLVGIRFFHSPKDFMAVNNLASVPWGLRTFDIVCLEIEIRLRMGGFV